MNENKLHQQLTFLQREMSDIKHRLHSLEMQKKFKQPFINIIKKELILLNEERKELIKTNSSTLFNGGEIFICNKLINLVETDEVKEART